MNFYSRLQINLISIIISIIIYFILIKYIPQLYTVTSSYLYYKSQPQLTQEYEEGSST